MDFPIGGVAPKRVWARFADYIGNSKQILKIMEDKENKREKNDATLDHRLTKIRICIARGCPTTREIGLSIFFESLLCLLGQI